MDIQTENDLTAMIQMLPVFGKHSNLVMAYLDIFQIAPMHKHMKKTLVLLTDMKNLFQSESFNYQKKIYKISQSGIVEALHVVVQRHFSEALDNHNYLKRVMISIAEREAKGASIQAERDLRQKEDRLMSGSNMPDEATRQGNLKRVGEIIKSIGG